MSVDALRGLVMIVMALDHTRDFFHRDAASFSPTDLARTYTTLFFTRWITHWCLPVFMLTAGIGVYLARRSRTNRQLVKFLWTRGIWFIVLEITAMRWIYDFNLSQEPMVLLLILWIFGVCMIAMAVLIRVPTRWLLLFSAAILILHDTLDGVPASAFGRGAVFWHIVHQPGVVVFGHHAVLVTYTLLPWIGVMSAGYCLGSLFDRDALYRERMLMVFGLALCLAFVILRAVNRYGDPVPWMQGQSWVTTLLSFINCTKYPASLDFLLMTLGPALVLLAAMSRWSFARWNPLIVFGRVPMFYFVTHFLLLHSLVVLLAFLRYGSHAFAFVFNPVPSMGGPQGSFPANFGYGLGAVYAFWATVVIALYPVCRWFGAVKSRKAWWASYL